MSDDIFVNLLVSHVRVQVYKVHQIYRYMYTVLQPLVCYTDAILLFPVVLPLRAQLPATFRYIHHTGISSASAMEP